ncbi:MAG: homocysteine biosynthesis protein, partial [Candidatus Omnitrophica bacterium]|nr:homocysteine biosynthesis protein [Candidatus Omnitrophota bacterium]
RMIYTYMGALKPQLGNANYCSAGQLSPLLKDPLYRTIGIGTRIFLGGGIGYVAWQGTQHNPLARRKENNVPCEGAGTLAVIGDLKQMKSEWLRGTSMLGYGVSLAVGIGVPIPVLDEQACAQAAVRDEEIYAQVIDYSGDYPQRAAKSLGGVTYAQLKSGKISVQGSEVPTGALSSYSKAKEISEQLKSWIKKGEFLLSEAVAPIPGVESGYAFKPLNERPIV